ncbi:MAG: ribulose phosphate epimerase [Myxococcota bacterium]
MRRVLIGAAAGVIGLGAGACGSSTEPAAAEPSGSTSTTTGSASTTDVASTSAASSTSTGGREDEGALDEGSGGIGQGAMCNLFEQDCAPGLKCAYACDTLFCEPTCRPVTGDGEAGDECVSNGLEGESPDDCGEDTLCFTGEASPGPGICEPFCIGSAEAPDCEDPDRVCAQGTLCLPRCDPLLQVCPDGQGCFAVDLGVFVCWNHPEVPIGDGEACMGNTLCQPGSTCLHATELPDCPDFRCCTPLCDLSEPDPCPAIDPSLQCVAYGNDEPEHANVGVCSLPS